MIRAIRNVIAGEGVGSAFRRALERVTERRPPLDADAEIVNVFAGKLVARNGGVEVQLLARLAEERKLRRVAVVEGADFESRARGAIHIEGTHGVSIESVLRLVDRGVRVVVSVHDFSWRGREGGLDSASGVIFPSRFLREEYGVGGEVIAPGSGRYVGQTGMSGPHIGFAGAVRRDKGAHLLPEIARRLQATLHVFGGGDVEMFRALRRESNVVVHGYYRSGTLPSLLVRHGIGLVLVPSIVPESFCLTMSEAWSAGANVAAFDLGAQAERIRTDGGGFLAPLDSGAEGLIESINRWRQQPLDVPRNVPSAVDAAHAHLDLYRKWGMLSR